MVFFVSFLLILIFFFPEFSFSAPLSLKINLEFYPKLNLLRGEVFTKLNSQKEYKLITSNLSIKNIKTSSNVVSLEKKGVLKIFNTKERSSLYIAFEKSVNPWVLPITIIHPPFPYPDKPFIYKITLKIPRPFQNIEIFIPSEEIEIKKTRNFLFYTFKIRKPILKPCIIMTTSKLKKIKFFHKNLNIEFYYLSTLNSPTYQDFKNLFETLKTNFHFLENIGGSIYPFRKLYIFVTPDNLSYTKSFSNVLFISSPILNNSKQLLHYLAEKKLEEALFLKNEEIKEGLITYLIDYQLAEDKKLFRKFKLSFPTKETKAFFYLLFLSQNIGEERFINFFRNFYENNIFSFKTWEDFLSSIKKSHPELKDFIFPYSEFKKLNLKIGIKSVKEEKNYYLIELTLKVNPPFENFIKSIPVHLKVKTENGIQSFLLKLENTKQDFHIFVKGKPEVLYLDPDYMLWRNLDFNEIPNCIARIFHSPGTLIVSKSNFPIYRKFINYFRNIGYELSFTSLNVSNLSNKSRNIIYLHTSPIPWQFASPEKGFYLKVIPNPSNPKYGIAYLYAFSEKDLEASLENLKSLNMYSEIYIQSQKIIFKRKDHPCEGIPVFINPFSKEKCAKINISLRKLALNLINSQIILVGINNKTPACREFYKDFVENIYNFNNHILLLLDLPPSFQEILEDYFKNKLSETQLEKKLKGIENFNAIIASKLINWAKAKKVKVIAIGTDSKLVLKVLTNGLKGLSQEDVHKLPEIDLLNPLYKEYLYSLFKSYENFQKFNFENFYEAQVLKVENLAENIKNFLKLFKNYQMVIITKKDFLMHNWKLPHYLKKRKISNFKAIFLTSSEVKNLKY